MKNYLYKNRFLLLLIIITILVCSANYDVGTILSGWDTLHPEFNFGLYFQRIFFGVWQEHQGLGALATQSHVSEIARMFIYFPLSFILPDSLLRYSYFFLTIILGAVGVYFFVKQIIFKNTDLNTEISSFLAGLFYLLNLGTLQHFQVPLEMFATHFASLPWLLLFSIRYLNDKKQNTLLIFSAVSFLSASMAHTSTLWFAFFGSFLIFLFCYCLARKNFRSGFKHLIIIVVSSILINIFWLLPNIYFLVNDNGAVANSKIHSLFSEEAFTQNQSFGTLKDLFIFKNFLFNWGVYVGNNKFAPLLEEWIVHLQNQSVIMLGYFFSLIAIIGLVYSIIKKNKIAIALLSFLGIGIFFWLNTNPPLGFIYSFLRDNIPLFKEALRFPFTKFSIILIFTLSIYFAYGISLILNTTSGIKKTKNLPYIIFYIFLIGIIYYALPAFRGNFISPAMRVKIPNEYRQMFAWFDAQPQGRIANLPINSFWGWTYHDWYYQGAGFLWFGIKQPLLDREFDRWSPENEQYYREMSQAVYSRNKTLFNNVIKKYNIEYILLDKSVIAPGPGNNPKTLFIPQIEELLSNSLNIKMEKAFGEKLFVYKVYDQNYPLFILKKPISVSPIAKSFYQDFAFEKYGDYISLDSGDINFPLRNIINNQNHLLKELNLTQQGISLDLNDRTTNINFPNYTSEEKQILADLFVIKEQSHMQILVYPQLPLGKTNRGPITLSLPVGSLDAILNINQKYNFRIGKIEENVPFLLGQIFLRTDVDNLISVYPSNEKHITKPDIGNINYSIFPCGSYDLNPVFGLNAFNQNSFSFFAQHAQVCMRFPLENVFKKTPVNPNFGQTLIGVNFNFTGDNQPNLCISKKDSSSCIYYFSKKLDTSNNTLGSLQYFAIKPSDIPNLEIKIFLDSSDIISSKKVTYENLSFNESSPLFETKITKEQISVFNIQADSNKTAITIPFSGNHDLSQDITKLPKTGGNCGIVNPRGPAPTSREVIKNQFMDYIRYTSDDGSFCDHFSYQGIDTNQTYLIAIKSRNIKGLPIRLCIANLESKRCDLYTILPKNKDFKTDVYLLPATVFNNGFDVNINNFAIKRIESINDIASINLIPIPYNWLSKIEEGSNPKDSDSTRQTVNTFSHPNSSLYTLNISKYNNNQTIVLSQTYAKGWHAYEVSTVNLITEIFPFVFGKELKDHLLIDNWANGWQLNNSSNFLVIVYLPQYLEYIGIIITILTFIIIIVRLKSKKQSTKV
nr:hypothetical protein [Candidatus Levybacteria bacterium]